MSKLDNLVTGLVEALPKIEAKMPDEVQAVFKALLEKKLQEMDLVSREEFDLQARVLAKTREKLERLEKRLQELDMPGE